LELRFEREGRHSHNQGMTLTRGIYIFYIFPFCK